MALNKDTIELVIFQGRLFTGVGFAINDGKLTFTDAIYFKDALTAALPAYMGIKNVKLSDLKDAENRAEMVSIFAAEFDIPQDDIEELVEEGLELALRNYEFAKKLTAAIKEDDTAVEE